LSRANGRYLLASSVVLAVLVPTLAFATGEGRPVEGGTRNPALDPSKAYTAETEIIADVATYGTRQSNKRNGDGGAAIYGCRSNPGSEPCLRATNIKGGLAFEFASAGSKGGTIQLDDPTGAPLTTNATGVATGLNADRVDGREGASLAAAGDFKFAVVAPTGELQSARGAIASAGPGEGRTYTITFDANVSRCSYTTSAVGESLAESFGVSAGSDPRTVLVDQSTAGAARGFHLQVIC
jgi:hypothetical protein